MSEYQNEVTSGIQLLDDMGPADWRDRINLRTLKIVSRNDCILGQIFGTYADGLYQLELQPTNNIYKQDDSAGAPYGFTVRNQEAVYDENWYELQTEWIKQLTPQLQALD